MISVPTKIHVATAATSEVIGVNDALIRPTPKRIHGVKSEPATTIANTGIAIAVDR